MFTALIALNSFHLLLYTQLTAIRLRREVVNLSLIYCHLLTQNLFFFALKQLQTTLWIVDALLLLIHCEQTVHPLWTRLSHRQMFMQNGEYTAFWYLKLLYFFIQLQFMIGQNEFVKFLVFSRTTAEFRQPERSASFVCLRQRLKSTCHLLTIISDGVYSEYYPSTHWFAWTIYFFHQKPMLYQHTKLFFPLFWKFATVSNNKVGDSSWGRPEGFLFNCYKT